jgi:hypothetical protein
MMTANENKADTRLVIERIPHVLVNSSAVALAAK